MNTTVTAKSMLACIQCQKTFKTKSNLNKHMLTHTSKKPYECDTCNKSYKMKFNLNRYQNIHTQTRSFKCYFCDNKIIVQNLERHLKVHTNEKPYKCDDCLTFYATKYELFSHKKTHLSTELRFKFNCLKCPEKFKTKEALLDTT